MLPLTVLPTGNHPIMGHGRAGRHWVGRARRRERLDLVNRAARVSADRCPDISRTTARAPKWPVPQAGAVADEARNFPLTRATRSLRCQYPDDGIQYEALF